MGVYGVTQAGLQTAALVRQVFASNDWITMIAIADAESTFNPNQVNPASGTTGLWQVNPTVWGSYIAGSYGIQGYAAQQNWLKTPINNAHIAAHILATQGLSAWANDGYQAYLGLAQQLLDQTAPKAQAAAPVVLAPTFGVNGTARVTSGGRILGTVGLHAAHGAIPYRVTMSVSPGYGSAYPTSTTTTGTVNANQTLNITQSLVAPIPAPEIIRAYQLRQSGPITFRYTVQWVVTDTNTGQSHTVNGGSRLALIVQ